MGKTHILIVDDEINIRTGLKDALESEGHHLDTAKSAEEALEKCITAVYDIIVTDLVMDGMDGIELTKQIKRRYPATEVIILTAYGTIETAVNALKEGAFDYMTKPVEIKRFRSYIAKIIDRQRLIRENRELKKELTRQNQFENILGRNDRIHEIMRIVEQAAPSDATVLIEGESGTGKELFARAMHRLSTRSTEPFITMNCGALPTSLFENELFGHEKGAFTNAHSRHQGCFERAHGGTVFLDEIAEMPLLSQVDLLRILEEGQLRRLGGTEELTVDVRVIAATNKDLAALCREGAFRQDLFFRLNIIHITLPPLRARRDDIPLLAQAFLDQYCRKYKRKKILSPEAHNVLCRYEWPGNVRELRNEIESAILLTPGETIYPEDLHDELRSAAASDISFSVSVGHSLKEVEKKLILETLKSTGGRREKAAQTLGISLRKLHYRLREYGM